MSRVVVKFNHLPRVKRDAPRRASELIRALAFEHERYVKQSFGASPSPVGGPPGVDTGALRASIRVEMTDALTAVVSDGVNYGIHLEFGTSRMGARPFMVPALIWLARSVARIASDIGWEG